MHDRRKRKDVAASALGDSLSPVWDLLCSLGRYLWRLLERSRGATDRDKTADRDVPSPTEPNPKWDTIIDRLTYLNALIVAAIEDPDPDPQPIKYAVAYYNRHPNGDPDSYTITVTHTEPADARHFAAERRPTTGR